MAEARAGLSAARELAAHHRAQVTELAALQDAPPTVDRGLRGRLQQLLQSSAERQAAQRRLDHGRAEIARLL
ncbi:hypothetical protein, partial [Streptomyces sp. SID2119]